VVVVGGTVVVGGEVVVVVVVGEVVVVTWSAVGGGVVTAAGAGAGFGFVTGRHAAATSPTAAATRASLRLRCRVPVLRVVSRVLLPMMFLPSPTTSRKLLVRVVATQSADQNVGGPIFRAISARNHVVVMTIDGSWSRER
jgi:hypothetical protein